MSVPSPSLPAAAPGGRLVRTLGLVAALSGLLVVLTDQITAPYIAENRRQAVERAVFQVLPGAVRRSDFLVTPEGNLVPATPGAAGETLYAGYDGQGRLIGVALQGAARGYQDLVRLLFGYSHDCRCVVGMTVLQMAETPGLGDKAASDPAFLANFQALDASLDGKGSALAHPIETVKHGGKHAPWQIDAISGATITSKAVGRALDASAERYLPAIERHLVALRGAP